MTGLKSFLKKKDIEISVKRYLIDAMSSMALGLFSTLLIGTIFSTLAKYIPFQVFSDIAGFASSATAAVLGIAIAYALNAPALVLFSCGAVSFAGYTIGTTVLLEGVEKIVTAGPAGAFLAVIIAAEFGKAVSKETNVDILVTPIVTIFTGVITALAVSPIISKMMYYLGLFVENATNMRPVMMGIVISVVIGIALTLPISSAAICAIIGISGIAGGAATAGACAQMVAFSIISFKENGWSGVVAQGLGTSMLQVGNITKNPKIWLPAIIASAIVGPLATTMLRIENSGVAAGMGTCGLVGPIGVISTMAGGGASMWISMILTCFILPAIIALIISEGMRKLGMIKENDMKIDV